MPNGTSFTSFTVLLDEPTDRPALGFDHYARSFTQVIQNSTPRFAVGIFGEWGSGKTTLMQTVEKQLESNDRVVTVWFNAWRYEKEEHLIVPLLDTLREGLLSWAERQGPSASAAPPEASKARRAAAAMGRAARALLAGLTVRGKLLAADLELSGEKLMAELVSDRESAAAERPVSLYHSSFQAMRRAIEPFFEKEGRRPIRRIVVFVDDLDRCLPLNALQVLESIKLLFDQLGFIFVVGLDRQVIERAIELKYRGPSASADGNPGISGRDYIKKIFQVPFALPRVSTDQLEPYFEALIRGASMPAAQRKHFKEEVGPHLRYIAGENEVNPREIKRLLNAYTLQIKILAPKVGQGFDHNVVLALQAIAFRTDWAHLYDALVVDPQLFVSSLRSLLDAAEPELGSLWLGDDETPVPLSFLSYVRGIGAPLLRDDLEVYVTSVESSRTTDTQIIEMQRATGRLRAGLKQIALSAPSTPLSDLASAHLGDLSLLERHMSSRGEQDTGQRIKRHLNTLQTAVNQLASFPTTEARDAWVAGYRTTLDQLEADLRELRRLASVGPDEA